MDVRVHLFRVDLPDQHLGALCCLLVFFTSILGMKDCINLHRTKFYIFACWCYFYPDVFTTLLDITVPQRIRIQYSLIDLALGNVKKFPERVIGFKIYIKYIHILYIKYILILKQINYNYSYIYS